MWCGRSPRRSRRRWQQRQAKAPSVARGEARGPDMSPLHQAGSRSPVRLVNEVRRCREARWFLEGEVPNRLRPPGTPVKRTDLYELESLRPWEAYKRRGRPRVVEHKRRGGGGGRIGGLGAL